MRRRSDAGLAATGAGRGDETVVWTGRELVVWAGRSYIGRSTVKRHRDGAAYDLTAGTWRPLPRAPLRSSVHNATVWTGAELIVFGGTRQDSDDQPSSQISLANEGARYLPPCRGGEASR